MTKPIKEGKMDGHLIGKLESLKPFLEAHHCSTRSIDEAVRQLREYLDAITAAIELLKDNDTARDALQVLLPLACGSEGGAE